MDLCFLDKDKQLAFSEFHYNEILTLEVTVKNRKETFEFTKENVIELVKHLDKSLSKKFKAEQSDPKG